MHDTTARCDECDSETRHFRGLCMECVGPENTESALCEQCGMWTTHAFGRCLHCTDREELREAAGAGPSLSGDCSEEGAAPEVTQGPKQARLWS